MWEMLRRTNNLHVADVGVASIQNLLDFNVTSGTVAKSFEGASKY